MKFPTFIFDTPIFSKKNIAIFTILLFHIAGFPFIVYEPTRSFFLSATPFNLLLSAVLLFWNHEGKAPSFFFFCVAAFAVGFGTEIIGVQTGILFGEYSYGDVLGWKLWGVPFVIGTNWWMCTYCCGIIVHQFYTAYLPEKSSSTSFFHLLFKAFIGSVLMVLLDVVLEPVAVKLGFWQWENNVIPLWNYGTWFMASFVLLLLFYALPFRKENRVAAPLYLTLLLFFAVL